LRKERRLRVLRGMFGAKREEMTWDWKKLHNEELTDLHCSSYIVRVFKLRKMKWAGHVARIGERKVIHRGLVGKAEGKISLEISGVGRRIILKRMFRKGNGVEGSELTMLSVVREGRFVWNWEIKFWVLKYVVRFLTS
jgi:hypothetical protein